jgi:uncharacterized membrane protein YbaN (DUF454 family)
LCVWAIRVPGTMKILLMALRFLTLGIGISDIILPVLPTTPFVLFALMVRSLLVR